MDCIARKIVADLSREFEMDNPLSFPQRKRLRLAGYDYSQAGMYAITICTHARACFFGQVVNGRVILNELGKIVEGEWERTAEMRRNVGLDKFVVMPNHLHALLAIDYQLLGHRQPGEAKQQLERIVAGFKSACTRRINELRRMATVPVWQRSFYDQIIRDERHLQEIRTYIVNNPQQWALDRENPDYVSRRG
ncbi:MAG: transposase [bacterium]|nr:transposase [bacterium]